MKETRRRFGELVAKRRKYLGMTQAQVWDGGSGPSTKTLTQIEQGYGPDPGPGTLGKLDARLQWQPGSAARLLQGGEPIPLEVRPFSEHDLQQHSRLLYELDRVGVDGIAARGTPRIAEGTVLDSEAVEALIRILEHLPTKDSGDHRDPQR